MTAAGGGPSGPLADGARVGRGAVDLTLTSARLQAAATPAGLAAVRVGHLEVDDDG